MPLRAKLKHSGHSLNTVLSVTMVAAVGCLVNSAWARPGAAASGSSQVANSSERIRWGSAVLRQEAEWYTSPAARATADNVLHYQSSQGGWPKSTDVSVAPRTPDDIPPEGCGRANSLDNDAFEIPVRFLARVTEATSEDRYRRAVERSIDYLLAAQYPNGGWPQFYPLREGYYSRITYNDGAMISALGVLSDAAAGRTPFGFIDDARRTKAATAVGRGIDCILRTQVKQDGKLTAWCAQHDERTLEPAWARRYEPPSLSGGESVGIVRFLMEIERPTPEIIAAIEGAVAWLKAVEIHGVRVEDFTNAAGARDRRVVTDPDAGPIWARFYEIGTNRPIFLGRDSKIRYAMSDIERERRAGYRYYGTWAAALLSSDYPAWRAKHNLPKK
jgi:PelA/Pel-15E family pectate lyase